jgi:hypothetical protein
VRVRPGSARAGKRERDWCAGGWPVSVVRSRPSVVYRVRCADWTGAAREQRQDSVPGVPQDGCCVGSIGEPFCVHHLPSALRASGGLGRVPRGARARNKLAKSGGRWRGARLGLRLSALRLPFLPPSLHPPLPSSHRPPPSLPPLPSPPSLPPSLPLGEPQEAKLGLGMAGNRCAPVEGFRE